jgi:hypothetical protein
LRRIAEAVTQSLTCDIRYILHFATFY